MSHRQLYALLAVAELWAAVSVKTKRQSRPDHQTDPDHVLPTSETSDSDSIVSQSKGVPKQVCGRMAMANEFEHQAMKAERT